VGHEGNEEDNEKRRSKNTQLSRGGSFADTDE
jgi:hypothetical protein